MNFLDKLFAGIVPFLVRLVNWALCLVLLFLVLGSIGYILAMTVTYIRNPEERKETLETFKQDVWRAICGVAFTALCFTIFAAVWIFMEYAASHDSWTAVAR